VKAPSAILAALATVALMTAALVGCQADQTDEQVDEQVDGRAADAADAIASGVGVVASGCRGTTEEYGSGVSIDRPGHVVTTAHSIAGATSIMVVDSSGTELPATVVAFDKDADLALLDVPGLTAPPLAVSAAGLGEAQAVVWSPDGGVRSVSVEVTKRLAITIEDIYVEDEVQRTGLELSGEISVGDSGGAVVNSAGDVIGIVYARSRSRPQTAFATDDQELTDLLRDRPSDRTDRCQ